MELTWTTEKSEKELAALFFATSFPARRVSRLAFCVGDIGDLLWR